MNKDRTIFNHGKKTIHYFTRAAKDEGIYQFNASGKFPQCNEANKQKEPSESNEIISLLIAFHIKYLFIR